MFRPMLAARADLERLEYPVLVSHKLDGVRALVKDGQLLSRTLKPIPNLACQQILAKPEYEGFDGELITGSPTAPDVYRQTVSQVMTIDGDTDGLHWIVFDRHDMGNTPYSFRYASIFSMRLEHKLIQSEQELLTFEDQALTLGYEGLILRGLNQKYKFGRSTVREGGMLKLKRFSDTECLVIGFEELNHNANPLQLDERGYAKHSHHQAGKIPMGTLGALLVNWQGQILKVGTGFTQADRAMIWENQNYYRGQLAKIKYLSIGMKDLPRHPVFIGWRDPIDIEVAGVVQP